MKEYNKLVRDKIPEIIEKSGKKVKYEVLDDDRYRKELDKKLLEEVNQYLKGEAIEDLADIVEVVLAILKLNDLNLGDLVEIMDDKKDEKGGFAKKIFLVEAED